MNKGEHEFATRKALEIFDSWNDTTGVVEPLTGSYYEILGIIEDAVRIGSMIALNVNFSVKDGELVYNQEAVDEVYDEMNLDIPDKTEGSIPDFGDG